MSLGQSGSRDSLPMRFLLGARWIGAARAGRRLWPWLLAASMVVLVVLWIALHPPSLSPPSSSPRTSLALAVDGWDARPFQGRLTGGFSHAPYDPEVSVTVQDLSSEHARALLVAEAAGVKTAGPVYRGPEGPVAGEPDHAERAHAFLLQGRAFEAVNVLESLARERPSDPRLASDLSAGLLERAARDARPADLVRALAEAERALELSPGLLEAAFNRALALDALYLMDASRGAWEEYLERDSASAWGAEAMTRLEWIAALKIPLEGPVQDRVMQLSSDGANDPALTDLAEGIALYHDQRIDQAFARLRSAEERLSGREERAALEARLFLALCHYQKTEYDRALALLREIRRATAHSGGLHALAGRSLQVIGLIHQIRGRRGEALGAYTRAAESLWAAGDRRRWAGVQVVLAELFDRLGYGDQAWNYRYLALAEGPHLDAYGQSRLYGEATSAMLRGGELAAARYFLEALLEAAKDSQNLAAVASAYRRLGLLAWRQGDLNRARSLLVEAESWAARIPDPSIASLTRGDVLLVRAEVALETHPRTALEQLERAEAIFLQTDFESSRPRLLLAKARAHRALGQLEQASSELDDALAALAAQRDSLGAAARSDDFFAQVERPILDEAVTLAVHDFEDPVLAFELVHEGLAGRRRFAGPSLEATTPSRLRLAEVQALLGPSGVLVQFYVLEDRLLVWGLDGSAWRFDERPIGGAQLQVLVEDLRDALSSKTGEGRGEPASVLREHLIEPIAGLLAPGDPLFLVPDGPLHGLPFSALKHPATERYLVEDHSLTLLVASDSRVDADPPRHGPRLSPAANLLVVADPVIDRDLFALPELVGARREAEEVTNWFSEATVLKGSGATPSRFLASAPSHDVIHFAGHAISNSRDHRLSFLVLSPESGEPGSGALFAESLGALDFSSVSLVVLAACSSAGSPDSGAGGGGLARTFSTAGAQSVVGSLWQVEDAATSELFSRFYEELQRATDPADALRAAQIHLIRSQEPEPRSPSVWAAFQTYTTTRSANPGS